MPYHIGVASDYYNLQQRFRKYLTGYKSIENEQTGGSNVGDGYIRDLETDTNSVAETITVRCTTGGGDGVAIFSIEGTVSGPMGTILAGLWFLDGSNKLILIMRAGPTDWAVDDEYTFDIVDNDIPAIQQWTQLKWTPGTRSATNNGMDYLPAGGAQYANELYLKGPGLAGQDEIFIRMHTFSDETGDYYNHRVGASLGFDTLETWDNQPVSSTTNTLCLWQYQMRYWIVANGRRYIMVVKVGGEGGYYMASYQGLFYPYGTPQEYPYPMYTAGGSGFTGQSATRWSSESNNHRSFFNPYAGYVYQVDGIWLLIQNRYASSGNNEASPGTSNIWPGTQQLMTSTRQSPGDTYPLLPMVIHTDQRGRNVYGELEGCFWTPGFANSSENIIKVGGFDYYVFQDVYRNGNGDYFALKME